ncbi:hypothetical protein AAZX31_14G181100 [Glycine max]|uniref:CASP-like protein n=2 Tax=Glycine subgen. Soja TaxID=1462606 RepID=I1MBD6_SOYBN|nr:CASP-like protein 1C1 [Glycine max]XP_028198913.1 CASP-like protein 1C1 [Glycine soja]KAG4954992.1 hypothetical protein JHK87_040586 [Glycine soja]KAG4966383.1 hypothetical protein JHK85_041358 [Glycine max]KAG5122629.1 hypothetical protein JHK84_040969 [Glycine max]KAH1095344.1 hypothetical protein GYH30_040579 [Glycine max]KAH1214414.1 CASP-like protein 1C1 [Glycine max]|eukprot:XP_003544303.1 CASP-like protein 1C1 [Glycine max]
MANTRRILHLVVRFVAFAATFCAAIIMAASHERGSISTMSFEAKYTVFPFFEYFLVVNSVATVYGFLVLFIPTESLLWQPVVAVDLVLTMALISSFSAAYAIGMVGMKGNSYWKPICGSIPKYCDKVTGAFVADLIAVVIYIILLLNSIHTALNPLLLKKKLSNFSG